MLPISLDKLIVLGSISRMYNICSKWTSSLSYAINLILGVNITGSFLAGLIVCTGMLNCFCAIQINQKVICCIWSKRDVYGLSTEYWVVTEYNLCCIIWTIAWKLECTPHCLGFAQTCIHRGPGAVPCAWIVQNVLYETKARCRKRIGRSYHGFDQRIFVKYNDFIIHGARVSKNSSHSFLLMNRDRVLPPDGVSVPSVSGEPIMCN